MNINDIKKNAPCGATHYSDDYGAIDYYRIAGLSMYYFNSKKEWWHVGELPFDHDMKPLHPQLIEVDV